jgi:hypothetical protein
MRFYIKVNEIFVFAAFSRGTRLVAEDVNLRRREHAKIEVRREIGRIAFEAMAHESFLQYSSPVAPAGNTWR